VLNLRDLYDEETELVFADWAHTNELGASLLARAVWRELGPITRARLDGE
jgi:hypothetical protein